MMILGMLEYKVSRPAGETNGHSDIEMNIIWSEEKGEEDKEITRTNLRIAWIRVSSSSGCCCRCRRRRSCCLLVLL